jgi:hypothetical protein
MCFGGVERKRAESRLVYSSLFTGGFSSPNTCGLLLHDTSINDDIRRPRCCASTGAPPSLRATRMQTGHVGVPEVGHVEVERQIVRVPDPCGP